MTRPIQGVGHIGDDDNRFCGRAVFADLALEVGSPSDLMALAMGRAHLSAADREVLRLIAVVTTSPDARVWPLKLARVLAAYGNPYAGGFGAQLASEAVRIGPGAAGAAAAGLAWIAARLSTDASDEEVATGVAEHERTRGRLGGFGVPFRAHDERLVALCGFLAHHAATRRPTWRLMLRVADAVRRAHGIEPNVAAPIAALLLDLGIPVEHVGMTLAQLMVHNFTAHAVEAARHDGPWLQVLPRHAIADRAPAPRLSPAAAHRGAGSAMPARRSLAW